MRIGIGYDVHAFRHGRPLILGGVRIEHTYGLEGHSDADVLVHAVMDAMLGSVAKGDIGSHFPDTDEKYRDADSITLLREIKEKTGCRVINVDTVIICQSPKLSPYIDRMRTAIADVLETDKDNVSVKATTTEHLGFTGREEGIAAVAVMLVE